MKIQIISIPNIKLSEIDSEDSVLRFLKIDEIHFYNYISELVIRSNINTELNALKNLFSIKTNVLSNTIEEIVSLGVENLNENYLEDNYELYLKESKRENTMDEYGMLLEIIKTLSSTTSKKKYILKWE